MMRDMDDKRRFFDEVSENQAMSHFRDEDIPKLRELISLWKLKTGDVILETGSGTGRLTPHLLEVIGDDGTVYCLDFALRMLIKAKERGFVRSVRLIQADASSLPLVDGCCDVVLCFSAFPHFSDKKKALEESCRALKPSGRLVISHLARREEINTFHSKEGHPIGNDLIPPDEEMRRLLSEAGFEGITITNDDRGYLVIAHTGRWGMHR